MLPQNGSSSSSDTGTGFSLSSSICLPEAECERTEVWAVQWQTKDYPCPYFTRCFGHNTISLYTTQHSVHKLTHTQHTNTHVYLQAAGWLLLLLLKRWSNEKKCQLVQRETATAVAAAAAIAGTATAAAAGSTAAQPALEVWAQQKAATTTTARTTKHVSNARHSEEY